MIPVEHVIICVIKMPLLQVVKNSFNQRKLAMDFQHTSKPRIRQDKYILLGIYTMRIIELAYTKPVNTETYFGMKRNTDARLCSL